MLLVGLCADVHSLALLSEQAQDLRGLVTGAAEPVRYLGVELRHFAGPEDQIVVSEYEPQATGQDVEPFVALVRPRLGYGVRGGNDHFPGFHAAGLPGQRDDGPPLEAPRLQVDPGVSDFGSANQIVERHVVGLCEREE